MDWNIGKKFKLSLRKLKGKNIRLCKNFTEEARGLIWNGWHCYYAREYDVWSNMMWGIRCMDQYNVWPHMMHASAMWLIWYGWHLFDVWPVWCVVLFDALPNVIYGELFALKLIWYITHQIYLFDVWPVWCVVPFDALPSVIYG